MPSSVADYTVYFITNRRQGAGFPIEQQTQMWLSDLGIQFPTVIVTKDKGPIVAALELDVFVDDKYANMVSIEKHSPKTKLFFMTQPQNEELEIPKNWTRVNDFMSFVGKQLLAKHLPTDAKERKKISALLWLNDVLP